MAPAFRGLGHDRVGIVVRIELERLPAELLHRDGGRLAVDRAARGGGAAEAVEEEPPARHQLHGVHPWAAWSAGPGRAVPPGSVPMSRTVVTPWASRSLRSRPSCSPALPRSGTAGGRGCRSGPGSDTGPWPSMTREPRGTVHSPEAPAQRIRSRRTMVTALVTGARPVPSQSVAPTMAVEGATGAGSGRRPEGPRRRPPTRPTLATYVETRKTVPWCGYLIQLSGTARPRRGWRYARLRERCDGPN